MPGKWNVIERSVLIKDEWLHLVRHRCKRTDGSIVDPYYVINGRDWVNIMPVTPEGKVYLIQEYRHGYGDVLTGLPGGLIDEGESPADAAVRELREETNLIPVAPLVQSGKMIVNPSTHTNIGYSFLALVEGSAGEVPRSQEPDIDVLVFDLPNLVEVALSSSLPLSGYDIASILRGIFSLCSLPGFNIEPLYSALRSRLRQN